jgi:PAS domain S-box-containing protein
VGRALPEEIPATEIDVITRWAASRLAETGGPLRTETPREPPGASRSYSVLVVPLTPAGGGWACALDAPSRAWTPDDVAALEEVISLLAPPAGPPQLEATWHALAENAPDIITRFDRDLRHVYVSPAIERETHLPAAAFLGKTHQEFAAEYGIPEPFPSLWHRALTRVLQTGDVETVCFSFPTPSGTSFFECRIAPELGPDGSVVSLLSVGRNVTEHRAIEDALRSSEERAHAVFQQVPTGVFFFDTHLRITGFNEEFRRMANLLQQELTGLEIRSLPDGRVLPAFDAALRGETATYEGPYVSPAGVEFSILLRIAPLRDGNGAVIGGVGGVEDHTRRVQAEERTRLLVEASRIFASTLELDATLDTLATTLVPHLADSCIVYLVDGQGEVRRLQAVHCDPDKQGFLREHLARHPLRPGILIPPVARVLETGRTELVTGVLDRDLRADPEDDAHEGVAERLGMTSLLVAPVVARGRVLGAISVGSSGGRERSAEEIALIEEIGRRAGLALDSALLHREVQDALNARRKVMQAVSHDLRNPLSSILLSSTALLGHPALDPVHPAVREGIHTISVAAEQMNRLIQDLLDVTRLEGGTLPVQKTAVPLPQLLRDAATMLQPHAEDKSVALQLELEEALPVVEVDPGRVIQVIANLVENAIRFSAAGTTIRLRAEMVEGEARVSVSDQGSGIPEEHLPHVFRAFWQGKSNGRRGAGLGLAIAKGAIDAHGGRIWVESRPGAGSTFSFTLPSATAAQTPGPGAAAAHPQRGSAALVPPSPGPTVLVVDDTDSVRSTMAQVLETAGCLVLQAPDGAEGVRLARELRPDLILLDLMMPVLDGEGAARAIRSDPEIAHTPMLAVTAQTLSTEQRAELGRLFDQVLAKPVTAHGLLEAVHGIGATRPA